MTSNFDELIENCEKKVGEINEREKQTWQKMDSLSEKSDAMVIEVERTAEKQVNLITTELYGKVQ